MAITTKTLRVASNPARMKLTTIVPKLFLTLCGMASLLDAAAYADSKSFRTKGSTQGIVHANPDWSLGVQLGNYGGTGVVAQKLGIYGGAVNAGLGIESGDLSLHADYIRLLDPQFHLMTLAYNASYNSLRGQLHPYFGGGVLLGPGLALRLPIGLQYTMLRDPFDFFGGLTLVTSRFMTDEDSGFELWVSVGARLLI